MYRPDEMAMILEQARQEAKKNRLAYSEKKTITWDGDSTGRVVLLMGEGIEAVRVSEEPIALTADTLKSLKMRHVTGEVVELKDEVTFQYEPEAGMTLVYHTCSNGDDEYCVWVVDQDFEEDGIEVRAGVYFARLYNGYAYTTSLSYEEIHPIPQEYIPPLDRLILNGTDGKQYALSVDSSGQLVVEEVTA